MNQPALPVDRVLPDLVSAFEKSPNCILSADPGAGKTTRVPPSLLNSSWLAGKKIIMLEPRRIAARRAAEYIAATLGELAGETVGYRIRGESNVGKTTRIEIVTEGILTRMLQDDSALSGTGLVIFDEFHERSIHADLGLALTLNVQEHLRPELRILVMSATLDLPSLSAILGNASTITSSGRIFPVATHYLEHSRTGDIEPYVVSAIRTAIAQEEGDLLVFLPGQREIRKTESLLAGSSLRDVVIHSLFGEATAERQQAALAPARSGTRKVILATSIAETSLTIDGVRVVIDSGLARSARFDPRRGMSGLVTTSVSQASADQRRGRAGRQAPGACYRLWAAAEQNSLPVFSQPEILVADLAPMALELARWGTPHGEGLRFIDPPPKAHLSQAQELLFRLGAIDEKRNLTKHGSILAELPLHPRFAHMLVRGKDLGLGALACDVAALLEERDVLRGKPDMDIALHSRWQEVRTRRSGIGGSVDRVRAQAARLRELIHVRDAAGQEEKLGILLALAYPERVAKRRGPATDTFQLAGGTGAILPKGSALWREAYLAIGDADGAGNDVKVFLAEPLKEADIREAFAGQLTMREDVNWNPREESVTAKSVTCFGALELSAKPFTPTADVLLPLMISGIREMGLNALPWSAGAVALLSRSEWLRSSGIAGAEWPDLSDEVLLATLESWLGPFLDGFSRRAHLARLDMVKILEACFSYDQRRRLDTLAPTHLTVPTGSKIPVEYAPNSPPILAVRLQEMFGQTDTPSVCGGAVKVLLHLLSPARRPLAVTQDLPSFWKNAYPGVRKDMRGRYPKHYWPENPQEAEPTKRTKRTPSP